MTAADSYSPAGPDGPDLRLVCLVLSSTADVCLSSLEGAFPSENGSVGAHQESTECRSFTAPTKEIFMEERQAKSE